jgi:hypothetical protein
LLKDLDRTEAARLRRELRVELNGIVEIKETANTYESTPAQVLVGRTTFGSLTPPDFTGRIVEVDRLPIPRVQMLPASMHSRIKVKFPSGREGTSEPLLGVSAGSHSCLLSAAYGADGNTRLSLTGENGTVLQSANVVFDPARTHELDIRPSIGKDGLQPLTLSCTFDGSQVLGSPNMKPSGHVPIMQTGLNVSQIPGVQARFTGSELTLSNVPDAGWVAPGQKWGVEVLILAFPTDKEGRHEPLLTSGLSGAGDFIYVAYQDANHVRIGLDHWNGSAVVSDPIEVDYHSPHEVWISSGPLFPDVAAVAGTPNLSDAERARIRSRVMVSLDGKTAVSSATPAYPSLPANITIGSNQIGGSSADATFSGVIYFSGRMNPDAVSW